MFIFCCHFVMMAFRICAKYRCLQGVCKQIGIGVQIWIQRESERGCAADGVGCRSVGGVGCWWCADGRCVSMVVCPLLSCRSVSPSRGGGGASQMRNARGGG